MLIVPLSIVKSALCQPDHTRQVMGRSLPDRIVTNKSHEGAIKNRVRRGQPTNSYEVASISHITLQCPRIHRRLGEQVLCFRNVPFIGESFGLADYGVVACTGDPIAQQSDIVIARGALAAPLRNPLNPILLNVEASS